MYDPTNFESHKHIRHHCENCGRLAPEGEVFCSPDCAEEYEELGPVERFRLDSPEMADLWFEC